MSLKQLAALGSAFSKATSVNLASNFLYDMPFERLKLLCSAFSHATSVKLASNDLSENTIRKILDSSIMTGVLSIDLQDNTPLSENGWRFIQGSTEVKELFADNAKQLFDYQQLQHNAALDTLQEIMPMSVIGIVLEYVNISVLYAE